MNLSLTSSYWGSGSETIPCSGLQKSKTMTTFFPPGARHCNKLRSLAGISNNHTWACYKTAGTCSNFILWTDLTRDTFASSSLPRGSSTRVHFRSDYFETVQCRVNLACFADHRARWASATLTYLSALCCYKLYYFAGLLTLLEFRSAASHQRQFEL